MIPNEILLVLVAGIAFYLGYRMGRMSAMADRNLRPGPVDQERGAGEPLPGPSGGASSPRPAPPASAGGSASGGTGTVSQAPRRTAKPPPARAGLLDTGNGGDASKGK